MSSVRPKLAPDAAAVITAWDTLTGRVVYRTASGGWSSHLEDGQILAGKEERISALEQVRSETMVNTPYAMQVDAGGRVAGREALRERLRANGPGRAARTEVHWNL